MRLNADLESGRSLVSHPRRKAGKGAVKLVHNEKRGAASLKPPPNVHDLAKAGVKSVSDACFSLLFVGSMSPFRAKLGSNAHRFSLRAGGWQSCGAMCEARRQRQQRIRPGSAEPSERAANGWFLESGAGRTMVDTMGSAPWKALSRRWRGP
jgi:hypothetical protein